MKHKNRWVALGLVFAGGIATWAAAADTNGKRPTASAEAATSNTDGERSNRTATLGPMNFDPKTALPSTPLRKYTVQVHNDFRQDATDPGAVGMLLGFEGGLTMGEVERTDTISWLYLHPQDLQFSADGNLGTGLAPEQRSLLASELAQGFFAGRNSRGQIVEYRFSRPLSSFSQGFLRLIAVTTQRVVPENATSVPTRWVVGEVDTAGEADVTYQGAGTAAWRKTKHAYTKLLTEAGLVADAAQQSGRTLEGEGTLEMDGPFIKQASLEEHASVRIDKATMGNDAEVRILPRSGDSDEHVAALRALLHTLPSVSALSLPEVRERPAQDRFRDILGEHTYDDLTKALGTLDPEDEESRRSLLQRFEADLNLTPSDASRLAARIGQAKEAEQSMIISALSNAETEEATTELRGISKDPALPDSLRETATALLGFTKDADEQTVGRLEHASLDPKDPQAATATLALGNVADLMRTSSPDRADDIVTQLLERLRGASDEGTQEQLLGALGNSGAARLVDDLAPWMLAGAAPIRAAAYRALRLVGSESALAAMAKGGLGDQDPMVRARVIAALAARPMPGTLQIAVRSLSLEPEATVRLEAVGVLGMLPLAQTEPTLQAAAKNDPDAEVRASALGLLKRDARQG